MQKVMPPKLEEGTKPRRLQVVVPETLAQRLDEWRATQRPIPDYSKAIRMMVESYLDKEGGK